MKKSNMVFTQKSPSSFEFSFSQDDEQKRRPLNQLVLSQQNSTEMEQLKNEYVEFK